MTHSRDPSSPSDWDSTQSPSAVWSEDLDDCSSCSSRDNPPDSISQKRRHAVYFHRPPIMSLSSCSSHSSRLSATTQDPSTESSLRHILSSNPCSPSPSCRPRLDIFPSMDGELASDKLDEGPNIHLELKEIREKLRFIDDGSQSELSVETLKAPKPRSALQALENISDENSPDKAMEVGEDKAQCSVKLLGPFLPHISSQTQEACRSPFVASDLAKTQRLPSDQHESTSQITTPAIPDSMNHENGQDITTTNDNREHNSGTVTEASSDPVSQQQVGTSHVDENFGATYHGSSPPSKDSVEVHDSGSLKLQNQGTERRQFFTRLRAKWAALTHRIRKPGPKDTAL